MSPDAELHHAPLITTQSEHTPCRITTPHVSKSPLVTSRVHCKVTDKRGMQHTRGITPSNHLLNVFVPYPSSPIPRMSYWAETGGATTEKREEGQPQRQREFLASGQQREPWGLDTRLRWCSQQPAGGGK